MIIGPDLRRWLADKAAQRQVRHDSQAFARAWDDGPVHRRLRANFAGLSEVSAEALAAQVAKLFADAGWVGELIEALAAASAREPFFPTPFRHLNSEINSGLLVYEDELVSIACTVVDIAQLAARKSAKGRATSVLLSGQVEVIRVLKSGGARLRFWSAPPVGAAFSAASAGQCAPGMGRRLSDGDTFIVDGRREGFVIEHARSSLLLLQASIKPDRAPVSVEYDHETRAYIGCSAADDSASRIQMITSLLRTLGKADAVPAMVPFLDHHCFFVRWHVMRELLGLDAQASLPHLQRMAARDPHPETRRAARLVLDRLEAPPPARAAA